MKDIISNNIISNCREKIFINEIERVEKFFTSDEWKLIASKPESYKVAKDLLNDIFGPNNYFIYDKKLIYDDGDNFDRMSFQEKEIFKKVERENIKSIVKTDNFLFLNVS